MKKFILFLSLTFIQFSFIKSNNLDFFNIQRSYNKENVIPLVVIGAGPAGLSAAMFAARKGIHTIVFAGEKLGGQITETNFVENWPGAQTLPGDEIIARLVEQAKRDGAVIVEDSIVDSKVDDKKWPFVLHTASGKEIHALSIIITTGASKKSLNIPGEKEYWGEGGIRTCALCDCSLHRGDDVLVVGGGDVAIEQATILSPYAKTVTILVRSDRMRAVKRLQDQLQDYENIKVIYNKLPVKILGNGKQMTGVEVKDAVTDEISILPAQGLFLSIGQKPNSDIFNNQLKITQGGYIELRDNSQETSVDGIYAAGDVTDNKYRQVATAIGDGCKAGLDATEWVRKVGFTDRVAKELKRYFYKPESTL